MMNVEQLNAIKQGMWTQAQAELAGIESRVRNKMKPGSTAEEVHALYEEQVVPYVIGHMMRAEAACAVAVMRGIIPGPAISGLIASLRGFCQAATAGRKAYCTAKPCEWRGEVSEAGPVGVCPLCQASPVSILDLIAPPSSNGHLRIVE